MVNGPAILLPCDPLAPRRTDGHFAEEASVARDLGGVTALIDHDALLAGDAESAVSRVPHGLRAAWYRGWMVPSAAYARLARALDGRGCTLLTTPGSYTAAHELPGWYEVFEGATPPSCWLPGVGAVPSSVELAAAAGRLGGSGPAVVKDYVKSRKHEWDEACFIPELADTTALHRVVSRFVELQGEDLAGGVVLRAFEPYAASGGVRSEESRVWWVDGEAVLVTSHPDWPIPPAGRPVADPDLAGVRPLVHALGCRFVTTDLARRTDDGRWRVVEVGDGQVSDLPRGADPAPLLAALITC
ncbi:ATP-grasp domain-containing protein [Streptacidiphilus griseoplanus]|uniref:ATP-grasp domain-containing protein n=1 Tax=Peterkaempfera griseoplana TaxID=66896 RepID=UPI0006E2AF6F